MTMLNNYIRDSIKNDLMARFKVKERDELLDEVASLYARILKQTIGANDFSVAAQYGDVRGGNEVLKRGKCSSPTLCVTFRGMNLSLSPRSVFNAERDDMVRLPGFSEYDNLHLDLTAEVEEEAALGEELLALSVRLEDYKAAFLKARKETEATLQQFRTFKQLEAAWPDVMPIANKYLPDTAKPISNLPMVQVDVLNAQFELPPEEQTEAPALAA